MEVGAVKQAFNNEVIQLKRNLNQAKIQTIHKLTRKAKKEIRKEAPEKLKEKFKRQAASAVNEVLIIKKIKPRDIARFTVTHTGELTQHLNKPEVDHDKACARLLLHKSLQTKYNHIRNTFSGIPIKDLLMSRQERLKLKREAMLDKKMKQEKKNKKKLVNAEGDWDVEDINTSKVKDVPKSTSKKFKESDDEISGDDDEMELKENANSDVEGHSDDEDISQDEKDDSDDEESEEDGNEVVQSAESEAESETNMETDQDSDDSKEQSEKIQELANFVNVKAKVNVQNKVHKPNENTNVQNKVNKQNENTSAALTFEQLGKNRIKPEIIKPIKPKDIHKNKNLKDKLQTRKFKKDSKESQVKETKVVDPFFITSTGENYMSVAEPRQPDEIKEIHKQGNRQERRAAMFGHAPKVKPRQDFRQNNSNRQNESSSGFRNKFNQTDGGGYNNKGNDGFRNRNDSRFNGKDNKSRNQNDKPYGDRNNPFKGRNGPGDDRNNQFKGRNDSKFKGSNNDAAEPKVEKLHPSWEAKKKQSGILPFQGKKIVFDEG